MHVSVSQSTYRRSIDRLTASRLDESTSTRLLDVDSTSVTSRCSSTIHEHDVVLLRSHATVSTIDRAVVRIDRRSIDRYSIDRTDRAIDTSTCMTIDDCSLLRLVTTHARSSTIDHRVDTMTASIAPTSMQSILDRRSIDARVQSIDDSTASATVVDDRRVSQ